MTKIVGISGKKQSGKTTTGNFLFGCSMLSLDLVEYANIDECGRLIVPYEDSNGKNKPCVFPVDSLHPNMVDYMRSNIWHKIKIYNFADNLKHMCINILGLKEEQCYGTEDEKNSLTNIKWSDCPIETDRNDRMTAREVMQFVGTDVFRKMYPNVWVDSTIKKIKSDNPELAVVVDCRFPNEVSGIKGAGGHVIRLERNIFGEEDQHPSEIALDNFKGFDAYIDNQNMSVGEQNEALYNILAEWEIINYSAVAKFGNP
tara:strand:- start:1601 stop:2374 length:774 start_codon:yes stop_codon:yes gene_type:complete